MPRGRPRKTEQPAAPAAEKPTKRPYKRKAAAAPAGNARFCVFEDGTLIIRLHGCNGEICPGDAADLHEFIGRFLAK